MPEWMQTPQFWLSLVLATAGCVGLLAAAKGKTWGWVVGLSVQPLWAVFGWMTGGYGLLVNSAMYATVYTLNIRQYRKTKREEGTS